MEIETDTPENEIETLQRGVSEVDLEAIQAARERELEEESVQLDKEIEEEIRGALLAVLSCCFRFQDLHPIEIPPEELASILAAPELLEFVDSTTKMFYRALNDYDYTRDYRVGAETGRYIIKKFRLLQL